MFGSAKKVRQVCFLSWKKRSIDSAGSDYFEHSDWQATENYEFCFAALFSGGLVPMRNSNLYPTHDSTHGFPSRSSLFLFTSGGFVALVIRLSTLCDCSLGLWLFPFCPFNPQEKLLRSCGLRCLCICTCSFAPPRRRGPTSSLSSCIG